METIRTRSSQYQHLVSVVAIRTRLNGTVPEFIRSSSEICDSPKWVVQQLSLRCLISSLLSFPVSMHILPLLDFWATPILQASLWANRCLDMPPCAARLDVPITTILYNWVNSASQARSMNFSQTFETSAPLWPRLARMMRLKLQQHGWGSLYHRA